ncbi:MAG: hypothetical protein IJU40_06870 [Desulfovibrionaceae bacterium]|nr:hypothetical protein [Desulfovibrionaceae bacterium]
MSAFSQLHMQASLNSTYADMQPNYNSQANRKTGLDQYKRQLVETRTVLFQKRAMQMVSGDESQQAEARRACVLRRVTREFWTNFVVKGEDTAMLRHLQASLRQEFGHDLQFYYPPGDVQMVILHEGDNGPEPVEAGMHATIVNRAWQLARDLVSSHMA